MSPQIDSKKALTLVAAAALTAAAMTAGGGCRGQSNQGGSCSRTDAGARMVCCHGDVQREAKCRNGSLVCPPGELVEYELTPASKCGLKPHRDASTRDADTFDGADVDGSEGPVPGPPEVEFVPIDGQTHVDVTEQTPGIRIHVPEPVTIESSSLQTLKNNVNLITWSDKSAVPTTKRVKDTSESGNPGLATIELQPRSELSDQWYAVRVEQLPSDFKWEYGLESVSLSDGATAARFRPDSHPLALGVKICPVRDGSWAKVIPTYSEPVDVKNGATAPSVSQPGSSSTCSQMDSEQPGRAECRPYDDSKPVSFVVPQDSVVSTTGEPVPPVDWTIQPDEITNGECFDVRKTTRLP